MYPSKELHQVWKRWLAAYRYIYNETLVLKRIFPWLSKYEMEKAVRKIENLPDWVKTLPGHQLAEAVQDALDAYQQAIKNNGFAKFKSCRASSQVIQFKAGNFKNGTWYPKTTKGLKFTSKQVAPYQCEYGTELVYKRGKWYACFPQYVEPTPTGNDRVIALDPGIRSFLTGYDGENILEIGKGDIGRIQRLCLHLDNLISRASKVKAKQRYRMRKAANRMRNKIQDLIKDLHNKTASVLVNSYKLILLPTFDVSQMVVKSGRKIRSKSVRQMLAWSHYKFEQHLKQAAERKGVLVVLCNESYTSKTCTRCGHIHTKLGGSKIHKCPRCGNVVNRDWGGAFNIMLRALAATPFGCIYDTKAIVVRDAQQ